MRSHFAKTKSSHFRCNGAYHTSHQWLIQYAYLDEVGGAKAVALEIRHVVAVVSR